MGVRLLTGDDEALLRTRAQELVVQLVGGGDRSLMVDEFDDDEYEMRSVVDAAQTMPFLAERRVVVARNVGRFTPDEVRPLVAYLDDELSTTELVLVAGGGRVPKSLNDAVKRVGEVVSTAPPRGKQRTQWVRSTAADHGVRIDGPAAASIAERLGDDVGRLDGIIGVLRSTFGEGAHIGAADVEPFLGEGGGVPPWDFTDAIDAGRTADALTLLGRMIHGGDRHPLQIMAILHQHYVRMACLDGVDARSEQDAAAAIGIKPGFPARKALDNYRRLGGGGVRRAIALLAAADADLRGATDLEPEVVMEILVARLSRLRTR